MDKEIKESEVITASNNLLDAWNVLKSGNYSPKTIEKWLIEEMKPAVDKLRLALKRDK